jgi:hypothetical protein
MPAVKGKGCGGRRPGAGRKPGSRNKNTVIMLAEIENRGEQLPSQFMRSIMNDPEAPLIARIMCARGSIAYIERRPAPALPNEIPVFREWTDEQFDDFERRTREDMRRDPHYYGRSFFEIMGEPWPDPQTRLTKGRPPSDRWVAEIDSKIDQRRHAGGPKPWAPGERERLLQTPFSNEERARGWRNGEEP